MAIENGADDYITKPFSFEIVTAKVKSQLNFDGRTQDYPEKLELEFKGKKLRALEKRSDNDSATFRAWR